VVSFFCAISDRIPPKLLKSKIKDLHPVDFIDKLELIAHSGSLSGVISTSKDQLKPTGQD
jgi:hypothetical protein